MNARKLADALFNIINDYYEGMEMPETVIVAISDDYESIAVLENEDDEPEWFDNAFKEKIDTKNLSDSVAEIAAFHFDER